MINIAEWTDVFIKKLHQVFDNRIFFVGLQGSYSRGEATETSDIDIVVILNSLRADDLVVYRQMLDDLKHRESVCGFLSGRDELMNWEPFDLLTLYYDTKPLFGSLDVLLPLLDRDAVRRAVRVGACNVYHGCVHNSLHGRSDRSLRSLFKNAVFVVQARNYLRTGKYISRCDELRNILSDADGRIVEIYSAMKSGEILDLDEMSGILFRWVQNILLEG